MSKRARSWIHWQIKENALVWGKGRRIVNRIIGTFQESIAEDIANAGMIYVWTDTTQDQCSVVPRGTF